MLLNVNRNSTIEISGTYLLATLQLVTQTLTVNRPSGVGCRKMTSLNLQLLLKTCLKVHICIFNVFISSGVRHK